LPKKLFENSTSIKQLYKTNTQLNKPIHEGVCGDLENENLLIEFTRTTKQGATTRLNK